MPHFFCRFIGSEGAGLDFCKLFGEPGHQIRNIVGTECILGDFFYHIKQRRRFLRVDIEEDGIKYFVGDIHRRAYVNSEDGRKEINEELAEPYLSAVMTVWGDTPTVIINPELR